MNQKPIGKTPERYPTCGARTRKGTPCRLLAGHKTGHPGKGRCKLHGGKTSGAPVGNKNAVTTGAYEEISFDRLTDTERELYARIDPSPRAQADRLRELCHGVFLDTPQNCWYARQHHRREEYCQALQRGRGPKRGRDLGSG